MNNPKKNLRNKSIYNNITKNKNLGISSTKEVKDLYTENYETVLKGIKDLNKWKNILRSNIGRLNISQSDNITQIDLQIQYNPYENPNDIFTEIQKLIYHSYGITRNPK